MSFEKDNLEIELNNALIWLKTNPAPEAELLQVALNNGLEQIIEKKSDKLFGVLTPNKINRLTRNKLIKDATVLLMNDLEYTLWKACKELSNKMTKFLTEILPHIRGGSRQCNNDLEEIMLRIFDADKNSPVSYQQLYRIAKNPL